jgi:hypothetical protein
MSNSLDIVLHSFSSVFTPRLPEVLRLADCRARLVSGFQ